MSVVELQRKTSADTLTPLPSGQLNNCILTCSMSPARTNHETNIMKLKCL